MQDEVNTNEPGKSIVDPMYREKMKGATDWVGEMMEKAALVVDREATPAVEEVKDKDGNVTTKAKPAVAAKKFWNLDAMFALAEANGIDTTKYENAREASSGVGRMRMTFSTMLRARAKRRHGLMDAEGKWHKAPEEFLRKGLKEGEETPEPTEKRDGTKIVKKKPTEDKPSEK